MRTAQNSMKHILIIGPRAYPSQFAGTSGVEAYVEQAIETWLKIDNQVSFTVLTRSRYQKTVKLKKSKRVKVIPVWSLPGKATEALSYTALAGVLSCFIQADIVWYHTAGMAMSSFLPKMCRKKVWVTIHSADWQRKKWSKFEQTLFFRSFRWMVRRAVDQLFAVSEQLATVVEYHTHRKVITTVAGLPEVPQVKLQSKYKQCLLYLGRLVPEKKIEWLLRFATEHHIPCVIAGSHGNFPEYEKDLRQRFTDLNIEWKGMVFGEEKWSLLRSVKLSVLPSELEGLPLAVLEAIACRTPCFVRRGILPVELEKLPKMYTFSGQTYEEFAETLEETLNHLSKKTPSSSGDNLRSLGKYEWGKTIRRYASYV